jgi:hypothetical protein
MLPCAEFVRHETGRLYRNLVTTFLISWFRVEFPQMSSMKLFASRFLVGSCASSFLNFLIPLPEENKLSKPQAVVLFIYFCV